MPDPDVVPGSRVGPTMALTFDTELIWGSQDHMTPREFEAAFPDVRGVIDAILRILERNQVGATWAIVGHLFLDRCERDALGVAHGELVRPGQRWHPGDWYAGDPCTDRATDPLWYGPDVVERIAGAGHPQEIGCHSFGHCLFHDPWLTREAAVSDLRRCIELAAARGIALRSMVFPRNREGHHDVLRELGFVAFRGADPSWIPDRPRLVGRALRLASSVVGWAPPVSVPFEELPGLWNIPGSALLMDRRGARQAIGRAARLRRLRRGMDRAIATGGTFHLWTHPFNLANDPAYLLSVLEDAIRMACDMREAGRLSIRTMGEIAAAAQAGAVVATDARPERPQTTAAGPGAP